MIASNALQMAFSWPDFYKEYWKPVAPVGGKIWKQAAARYKHRYREVKSISEKITSVHLQLNTKYWTLCLFLSSSYFETDPFLKIGEP